MLKIIIDGRMHNESGIGRYIRNLIYYLQLIDKENEYFILHLKKDFDSLKYSDNFRKILADFGWYGVGEQIKLLKLFKGDLVHFPHFNIPIFYQGKFVVTIHDLIHQHFSMKRASTHNLVMYKLKQLGYKVVFKNALSKSAKILVPSNFVKNQLVSDWRVKTAKIAVTPEGVDASIVKQSQISNARCQILLKKLNVRAPYIFYVGNAHPHKNVAGLIRAFCKLRGKYPGLSLVLAGYDHYFWQKIKNENQFPNIVFTGFITDEELAALYKQAECFVMPSLEEGFGIPLLEAMSCLCPVASSAAGSLKEVGGDAAIYFDPQNTEDMQDKIECILKSESLRNKLIAKGRIRANVFSWKKLARETLEVYKQCG